MKLKLLPALVLLAALPVVLAPAPALAQTLPWDPNAPGQSHVDSDGDGVNDDIDAEPCNPRVSARVFVPADRVYGMMLFEDSWPRRGDFDFNDAALAYNQVLRYDSAGQLTGLRLELSVLAVGAGDVNGLALRLPNTARTSVSSISYRVGNQLDAQSAQRLDPNQSEATIILSEDLHGLFNPALHRTWINSDPTQPVQPYVDLVLEVALDPGHNLSAADAPFDLFLFNRERGTEVHRPRYAGTSQLNAALFNTADDGSTANRHFVTTAGIPFVLELPELTNYPRELVAIDEVYPNIVLFGASAGTQGTDFYRHPAPGGSFGLTTPRPLEAQAAANVACYVAEAGLCGTASGTGSVAAPQSGLCAFGLASTPSSSGGLWRWSCTGNYSTPTSCTAPAWVCQPNLASACTIANGTGTRTCNGSGTGYGACTAVSCNGGYFLSGNSCVAQVCSPGTVQGCAVTNGTGQQTCDNLGSGWSACTTVSCNPGFTRDGNSCVGSTGQRTFSFTDTTADNVPATAVRDFFNGAAPISSSDWMFFSVTGGGGSPGAWCAQRSDWYASNYLAFAHVSGSATTTSGSWQKFTRPAGGSWSGPVTAGYTNYWGTPCDGQIYSWCSEWGMGGRSLAVMPAQTGSQGESYAGGWSNGAGWQVMLRIGSTRMEACGF